MKFLTQDQFFIRRIKLIPSKSMGSFLFFTGCCFSLASCASTPNQVGVTTTPHQIVQQQVSPPILPVGRHDIKHIVGPGETVWRLSKMYDVPSPAIMGANHINSSSSLTMGQTLLIPGAIPIRPVLNLIPSKKWQYIIIHHSATEHGSSLHFNKAHLAKGWDKGVGYDFVIDNRSEDKEDGQIEETPRWIKQIDGAHCKASDMNKKAIGICLVGNFDEEVVTQRQIESLVWLVHQLQGFYHIPTRNIIRHGHVPGASTDCPGKRFPWEEFIRRLGK